MCQRECLAGEPCEHIAICHLPPTKRPPTKRNSKLCSCECPECGATVRFDVEMDLIRSPYSVGSACDEFYVDCPLCEASINIEVEAKIAAVSVRY